MSLSKISSALCATLIVLSLTENTMAEDTMNKVSVQMNMARIVKLPADAATVIIGMPAIADAVIQDQRTLVLTGKGFGATNIIALDAAGNPISDLLVHVSADSNNQVTVFRKLAKSTISCTPNCQPMVAAGDDPDHAGRIAASLATARSVGTEAGY